MKDYLIHYNDHEYENSATTLTDAKIHVVGLYRIGHNDITIDEYIDNELTGIYWVYKDGKLKKYK